MSHQTPQSGPAKPVRSTASSAILIATSVVGGFALLGAVASAAFGLRAPEPWEVVEDVAYTSESVNEAGDLEFYADAIGVTSIEIDADASAFTIKYDDVEEAVLLVQTGARSDPGAADDWWFERDSDDLVIKREGKGWGTAGCLIGCGIRPGEDNIVTLTLPRDLGEDRSASLDVTVNAGTFTGAGSFDSVDIEVNAGEATFEGDARALDVDVQVGSATVNAADVTEAEFSVTTGEGTLALTGAAPNSVTLNAEMGSLTAQLPTEKYRVDAQTELGSFDNRLNVSKDSKHVVSVRAELADVILK